MTRAQPALEDFESGFDADDEFAVSPPDPFRDLEAAAEPASPALLAALPAAPHDPFAALDADLAARAAAAQTPDVPVEAEAQVDAPPAREPLSAAAAFPPFDDEPPALGPLDAGPADAAPAVPAILSAEAEAFIGGAMAPRIAIHIYCERPETVEIAERAAADRRLARATTVVRTGGLAAALDAYGASITPPLIIVESSDPADTLLAGLDRLAEACDAGTKVVVIGRTNDIGLYRALMARGVSEYLVPPFGPLQLIKAITDLYSDPDTAFVGRTVAFVGAKGGVGASTLAHNFAWAISEHVHAQTCVVDYDLAFGTAGLDFNQDPLQGVHDALAQPDRVDSTLLDRMAARCTERLSLFAAPASLDEDWEISAAAYEEVGQKLRSAAPFVVLDLPHLWSAWMRATLMASDDVVVVAGPDLASLRNGKNLLDLIRRGRPNDRPPLLILNQVGLPGRPEIPVKDYAKAIGMEPTLVLPFDAKLFGQASNNGQMIFEVNPKAKASEGMLQFVQQISRREIAPQKPKSLLTRLTGRG